MAVVKLASRGFFIVEVGEDSTSQSSARREFGFVDLGFGSEFGEWVHCAVKVFGIAYCLKRRNCRVLGQKHC